MPIRFSEFDNTTADFVATLGEHTDEILINRLKKEIEVKALTRDKLRKIAQEEADGTGGSLKVNAGPIRRQVGKTKTAAAT